MTRKQKFTLITIALTARLLWCYLGWHTSLIEAYENNISIVYQRSAYLMAFGYGYVQTEPGSPAYDDLMVAMDHILHREEFETEIDSAGIYSFEQYPPGWPLLASILFQVTKFPIPYLMQFAGIIVDLITLFLFIKIFQYYFSKRTVLIASFIYAVYPPVLSMSLFMTPDSWTIFFIALLFYIYFFIYTKKKTYGLILMGFVTGIGVLFRPDFLFITFFLFLGDFMIGRRFTVFLKQNSIVYLTALIVLLPWGIYNKIHNHHFIITSTALGATLVSGFAAYDNPEGLGPSDVDRLREANSAGISHPFEYDGNQYFKNKFLNYISEHPLYYLKTTAYRSMIFLAAPYLWGIEQHDDISFSSMTNAGTLGNKIKTLVKHYFLNILTAIISLLGNISLIVMAIKNKKNVIPVIMISIALCIYLSHVFIHMTPTYAIPLVFFQLVALVEMFRSINRRKVPVA